MKLKLAVFFAAWVLGAGILGSGAAPATNGSAPAIVLAAYVQAQSAESVVIQWRTAQPAYGWVEYGETQGLGQKRDAVVNGLRVANVRHHRITLEGLRPGTRYWYQVCFKPIRSFGGYRVDYAPEERCETASFQTLPGAGQSVRAVVFNDLHNNLEAFAAVCRGLEREPFDFSLFNGDCLADPEKESQVLTSLAAFNQGAQAGGHPVFYVRGNHETRGAFARELPGLLAWPGDKPYFAFSAGAVRFLVLDCGEDKPDDHREYSGLADFTSFRREETAWLKQELGSPAFRRATWRVLVHHIPLYPTLPQGGNSQPAEDLWAGLLAKAKIDLALNAHLHHVAFHPAQTVGNPYPLVIGGGNRLTDASVMLLEADRHHLKLRVLDAEGKEKLPEFERRK